MSFLPQSPETGEPNQLAELVLPKVLECSEDAVVASDLDGRITMWAGLAERIFGYHQNEAVGQPVAMIVPPAHQRAEFEILGRVGRGDHVERRETFRRRKDGQEVGVSVVMSSLRAPDGRIVGVVQLARDLSSRKRADDAAFLLAAIVNSSDDAMISKNLDGVITSWNDGAQRIFGYPAEEAVGKPVSMLAPTDRRDEEAKILERLRRGERINRFQTVRVRRSGEEFPVSLTISPVRDAAGTVVGASEIARDITQLKRVATEREQLLQRERAARIEAEQVSRLKDEFLATASHELRTPLNAIVGWTQVLKDVGGHSEDIREGLEVIERNARAQAQLIDDLLDLGRIATGKLMLAMEPLELGVLVKNTVASLRPAADLKQVELRFVPAGVHDLVRGDKQRLQQVLWNLLSNAIKFTPSSGTVTVSLAASDSRVEIRIADTGCGIAADFLPHVFERFRQADSSTTRRHGGLGIGLAIVKQLVELQDGEVRAESPGMGKGATFSVSLPKARMDQLASSSSNLGGVEAAGTETLQGVRILAVDDDHDSLHAIKRILTGHHAEVKTAMSTDEAIAVLTSFRPDILVSDIGMPQHDGYELIQRIRRLPGGTIPAVALTALARSEDRMRALHAGFQAHLAKPMSPQELVAVVASLARLQPRGQKQSP